MKQNIWWPRSGDVEMGAPLAFTAPREDNIEHEAWTLKKGATSGVRKTKRDERLAAQSTEKEIENDASYCLESETPTVHVKKNLGKKSCVRIDKSVLKNRRRSSRLIS